MAKANFTNQMNNILKGMRTTDMKQKGTKGEEAVFKLCEQLYQRHGGILYHSYSYKVDKKLPGNIKKNEDGSLRLENLGDLTEIDVLYVSPYRVFPIEVKSYSAKQITLKDDCIEGTRSTGKSPVHQNEMHCRHLYSHIFRALPDGKTDYIVPIVVFVDRCKLVDKRSAWQKEYIYKAILNNLKSTLVSYNVPGKYSINLKLMEDCLKEAELNHEKFLPARYVGS